MTDCCCWWCCYKGAGTVVSWFMRFKLDSCAATVDGYNRSADVARVCGS